MEDATHNRIEHSQVAIEMSNLDLQFQSNGVSLPSPEDHYHGRTAHNTVRKPGKRYLRWAVILTGTILLIGTIVGVGVGVASRRRNSESAETSGSSIGSNDRPITPGAPSEAEVIAWLVDRQISDRSALRKKDSPQYHAMQYLRSRTDPTLPVSKKLENRESYLYMASYVLAVIYYGTKGESSWSQNLDFVTQDDVCEWTDIKKAIGPGGLEDENAGLVCDSVNGIPVSLDLELNNVTGKIPTELGLLTSLQHIDLSYNALSGPLPTELCQLNDLRHLEIGHNFFTGSLPSCMTQWTELTHLIAPLCGLSGILSENIFCSMTRLQELSLAYNNYEGSLPKCDGNDWPDMVTLHLSDNMLTGGLPSELATIPYLSNLLVDDNDLSGNPLGTMNQLVNIVELYIEGNSFSGVIDSTFGNNLYGLSYMDMSNNQFGGSVPSELFTLPSLIMVDLSSNRLQGQLPTDVAVQDNMRFLSLFKNQITGPLPSSLANLRYLQHLDLANNKLTGDLNADSFAMESLINIFMSENPGFTRGPIPDMFGRINLKEISLRNTNRAGTLPTFESSTLMHLIDLGNNALTGSVPPNYGTFTNLGFLLLDHNPGLNGTLPTFREPSILNTVIIDRTSITGDFNSICNLPMFLGTDDIYEGTDPILLADCGDADSGITCQCCKCCTKAQLTCSEPTVDSLNYSWEHGFNNVARDFGLNHTLFPDSTNR